MRCDICGEDFANSEEVKAHKEREHPVEEQGDQESVEEEAEMPDPAVRPWPPR